MSVSMQRGGGIGVGMGFTLVLVQLNVLVDSFCANAELGAITAFLQHMFDENAFLTEWIVPGPHSVALFIKPYWIVMCQMKPRVGCTASMGPVFLCTAPDLGGSACAHLDADTACCPLAHMQLTTFVKLSRGSMYAHPGRDVHVVLPAEGDMTAVRVKLKWFIELLDLKRYKSKQPQRQPSVPWLPY